MNGYPKWLETEDKVKTYFSLFGFSVSSISISGRQIDILANKRDKLNIEDEKWAIEVTLEYVGEDKGSSDYQKLALVETEQPGTKLMMISLKGFTDDQRATLKKLGVVTLVLSEFESMMIDFSLYVSNSLALLNADNKADDIGYKPNTYIFPSISERLRNDKIVPIDFITYFNALIEKPDPVVISLLGNLGSGKTSLLQHIQRIGCEKYQLNPSMSVVPFYIPLGKYKQHSGNLEQMMMSELKSINESIYPTSLINYYLKNRKIILLLDGLDEIHPIQSSTDILETVTTIMQNLGSSCSAIISCRRQFFENTSDEMAYFGPFTTQHMEDVQENISKLLRGQTTSRVFYIDPFDRKRIDEYLLKRCLLEPDEIDTMFNKYYGFRELCETPVLLSMIATTISNRELFIELEKTKFPLLSLYHSYTNRWLERDVNRAQLSFSQRYELSCDLATDIFWEGNVNISWSRVKELLHKNPKWRENPISDDAADIDIRNSGFLIRDLDDTFRFSHRSIMEYFAAKKEIEKMQSGSNIRHFPSDGYRTFVLQMLANDWLKGINILYEGNIVTRNEYNDNQLLLLAEASTYLSGVEKVILENIRNISIRKDISLRNVSIGKSSLELASAKFINCSFNGVVINCMQDKLVFEECEWVDTVLKVARADQISIEKNEMNSYQEALGIIRSIWDYSLLISNGAKIYVGQTEWTIKYSELYKLSEIVSRVKGKVRKENWKKGKQTDDKVLLMEQLIKQGFVNEDTSREGHQLKMSPRFFEKIGAFNRDPLANQNFIINIFKKIT